MSDSQTKLLFAITTYLKTLSTDTTSESVDVAVGLIESTFGVEETVDSFSNLAIFPVGLQDVFDAGIKALNVESPATAKASVEDNPKFLSFIEVVSQKGFFDGSEPGTLDYARRYAKLVQKFKEKAIASGPSQGDVEKLAEEKKGLGNNAVTMKDYDGAIKFYTEAIELSPNGPNSHVFYCNRAAAHCHLNNYIEAVEDCKESVNLNPEYTKAYSRLGLANYFLERYEEAVEAYEMSLKLEPENKSTLTSLNQARNKIADLEKKANMPVSSAPRSAVAGMVSGIVGH